MNFIFVPNEFVRKVSGDMSSSFMKHNFSCRNSIRCSVLILFFSFSNAVQADRILEDLSDNDRLKRLERMFGSDFYANKIKQHSRCARKFQHYVSS